jgi:hypothetical protein
MEGQATQKGEEIPAGLDALLGEYKAAVEECIVALHEEEALAVPDHSMRDWDVWERAGLDVEAAREKAVKARKAYENALRKMLLNF